MEANATLVLFKQQLVLFTDDCVNWEHEQEVVLILAMLTVAFIPWC